MNLNNTIKLQQQVRHNAEDLQTYARELKDWEESMKRKDTFLKKETPPAQDLPAVRSKKHKPKPEDKKPEPPKKKNLGFDYSAWDKFDVEKACKDLDNETSSSEDEEDYEKDRLAADDHKLKGNEFVKQQKWGEAIICYTKAIELYDEDAIYFANRALCHIKKENWRDAERDCVSALDINPNYVKAFHRRSVARAAVGNLLGALEDLSKVLFLEPKNKEVQNEIIVLEKKLSEIKQKTSATIKNNQDRDRFQELTKPSTSKLVTEDNKDAVILSKKEPLDATKHDLNEDPFNYSLGSHGDGRVLVIPFQKPPHLRSKKPLKRICIKDVDRDEQIPKTRHTVTDRVVQQKPEWKIHDRNINFVKNQDVKNNYDKIEDSGSGSSEYNDVTNEQNPPEKFNNTASETKFTEETDLRQNSEHKKLEKTTINTCTEQSANKSVGENPVSPQIPADYTKNESVPGEPNILMNIKDKTISSIYEKPKTYMQFYSQWREAKKDQNIKFELLKSVSGSSMPELFGTSLESDLVSDMLFVLVERFVTSQLPVWPYLIGLSKVPRFSAIRMFMSQKDIEAIKALMAYSERYKECTKEELQTLKVVYELVDKH